MKNIKLGMTLCLGIFMLSCSSDDNGTVTANIKSLSSGKLTTALRSGFSPTVGLAAGDFGAAAVGTSGLSSFKLYIKRIQFCNSVTISGSAYNNPTGCSTVYDNELDNYNTFDVAAAAGSSTGKYFDLLSSTDRAKLTQKVSLAAGTYNVGIIDWYRPIKITATVPLSSGTASLYTKTCPSSGVCDVTGMETAPAQESIVDFGNGGTWMKFLKPLVVTKGEDLVVDLAFDLEQRVFGGDSVSNGEILEPTGCTAFASGYCGIYAPILRLMPVAHKTTESTVVESYEMSGPSAEWNIRTDIYYDSGDADKSILAADLFTTPTASTASSIAAGVYVYTVVDTKGVVTFQDVNGNAQLTDFTRGDTGTATLTCPSGATLAGCTAGTQVQVTWTSRTIRTL